MEAVCKECGLEVVDKPGFESRDKLVELRLNSEKHFVSASIFALLIDVCLTSSTACGQDRAQPRMFTFTACSRFNTISHWDCAPSSPYNSNFSPTNCSLKVHSLRAVSSEEA